MEKRTYDLAKKNPKASEIEKLYKEKQKYKLHQNTMIREEAQISEQKQKHRLHNIRTEKKGRANDTKGYMDNMQNRQIYNKNNT